MDYALSKKWKRNLFPDWSLKLMAFFGKRPKKKTETENRNLGYVFWLTLKIYGHWKSPVWCWWLTEGTEKVKSDNHYLFFAPVYSRNHFFLLSRDETMTFFPQKGHTFISRHFLKSFPINFLSRRNAENHIAQKLKKKKLQKYLYPRPPREVSILRLTIFWWSCLLKFLLFKHFHVYRFRFLNSRFNFEFSSGTTGSVVKTAIAPGIRLESSAIEERLTEVSMISTGVRPAAT